MCSEKGPKAAKTGQRRALLAQAHLDEHMGRANRGFSFDVEARPMEPARKEKKSVRVLEIQRDETENERENLKRKKNWTQKTKTG